ncbi:MAG: hypothetical protein ACJAS1_007280, partial [Oleiphilaceae bacterium]
GVRYRNTFISIFLHKNTLLFLYQLVTINGTSIVYRMARSNEQR